MYEFVQDDVCLQALMSPSMKGISFMIYDRQPNAFAKLTCFFKDHVVLKIRAVQRLTASINGSVDKFNQTLNRTIFGACAFQVHSTRGASLARLVAVRAGRSYRRHRQALPSADDGALAFTDGISNNKMGSGEHVNL